MSFLPAGPVLAALLALEPAVATAPDTPEITNPSWIRRPADPEYPLLAAMLMMDGRVLLRCTVTEAGLVGDCAAQEETPSGLGFAQSGIAALRTARLQPRRVDGRAERARVNIPFNFMMPAPEVFPSYTGPEPTSDHIQTVRQIFANADPEAFRDPSLLEGVDADRARRAMEMLARVEDESALELREAFALGIARNYDPRRVLALEAYLSGGAEAAPTRTDMAAFDAFRAALIRTAARLRTLYCAEFDCGTPEPFTPVPAGTT